LQKEDVAVISMVHNRVTCHDNSKLVGFIA
jgi:hypothetical protein